MQEKLRTVMWRHSYLSVSKTITVYHDIPRIDCVTKVDNRHPQIRLRLKFNTDIQAPKYTSEIQFGAVDRTVDQGTTPVETDWVEKPCGVFPALNWIDYSDNERGITLINQGLPAHQVQGGTIFLTLFRSVMMLSADGVTGPAVPTPDAQEFKKHVFEYSLYPHSGGWKEANSFLQGNEVNSSLEAFQITPPRNRRGLFPQSFSFVEVSTSNIILTACKRAENGKGIILRLYEAKGESMEVSIQFFTPVSDKTEATNLERLRHPVSAKLVNLLEAKQSDLPIESGKINLTFKPFEIISLEVGF
jgi:alpha-mannosidase